MSGWRKKQIAELIDVEPYDLELVYAEEITLQAATEFLIGDTNWNKEELVKFACDLEGFDHDLVWLISRVLFGPAVVYQVTGKTV